MKIAIAFTRAECAVERDFPLVLPESARQGLLGSAPHSGHEMTLACASRIPNLVFTLLVSQTLPAVKPCIVIIQGFLVLATARTAVSFICVQFSYSRIAQALRTIHKRFTRFDFHARIVAVVERRALATSNHVTHFVFPSASC